MPHTLSFKVYCCYISCHLDAVGGIAVLLYISCPALDLFSRNQTIKLNVRVQIKPLCVLLKHVSHDMKKKKKKKNTPKMSVCPAKTQISLGIRPIWSESSLCAQWVCRNPSFLQADSEDSDQTGRMPRRIWVIAGRTCHFVGFVMSWLMFFKTYEASD